MTGTLYVFGRNGFMLIIDNHRWRNVQRAVTMSSFHVSSKGLYDTVLVSGDNDRNKFDAMIRLTKNFSLV